MVISLILMPVLGLMLFFGYLTKFALIFASMALHELAHILWGIWMGGRLTSIKILPIGLSASIDHCSGRGWRSALLYAAGPCANTLIYILGVQISSASHWTPSDDLYFFILTNAYLAVFNVIPILPMDGGRLLVELLESKLGRINAGRVTGKIASCMAWILVALGIIQFLYSFYNFSLIAIGLFSLIVLRTEKMEVAFMNVKHILYRRSRLMKKGVYPARDLVVIASTPLCEIIKNMDFDRFHFVYVLDEHLKLLRVFTEQEIIEALLENSTNITFDDLVRDETRQG